MTEKPVIMCTHGPEDPERATIPFVLATAAQASDVEVELGLQATGVLVVTKGQIEHLCAPGFPPLRDLVEAYVEAGGKMYACGPCLNARQFKAEDLIEGASIINAAAFVKKITEATSVLVY